MGQRSHANRFTADPDCKFSIANTRFFRCCYVHSIFEMLGMVFLPALLLLAGFLLCRYPFCVFLRDQPLNAFS